MEQVDGTGLAAYQQIQSFVGVPIVSSGVVFMVRRFDGCAVRRSEPDRLYGIIEKWLRNMMRWLPPLYP